QPPADPEVLPWWTGSQAGWLGGILGTVVGLGGALVGVLSGFPKTRPLVLKLMAFFMAAGAVSLVVGLYALFSGQPYAVWYGLTHTGFISVLIFGFLYPVMRSRFAQMELQKMAAKDS
ncbi:MAG: hypothetical protein AAF514_21450, partial [Verrucomicrobiota bacterium]